MARFALKDKHYLNVPGTEWEQKETNQQTGKQMTMRYPVGLYLDPNDPADWNYPTTRQIIVSTKRDNKWPGDIVFTGPPTRDMDPLDDEAEEMIASMKPKGDPFADLPSTIGETFSDKLLVFLEAKLSQVQQAPPPPQDDRVAKLEEEIAELKKLLTANLKVAQPAQARRT